MRDIIAKRWMQLSIALVLMLFFIGFSVVFTLSFRPLYYADMERLDIAESTGIPNEVIRRNYDALIDYSMAIPDGTLEFPDLPMSEEGRIHFAEVKDIFDIFKWMAMLGGVVGLALAIYSLKVRKYAFLKYTAILSVTVPLVLSVLVGAFWEKAFVIFHKIFFRNDFWLFDVETDPVILILPDEFFMHCAFLIFGGVILFALLSFVGYLFLKKRER